MNYKSRGRQTEGTKAEREPEYEGIASSGTW